MSLLDFVDLIDVGMTAFVIFLVWARSPDT